ncbi:MAG TPA: hypothetical protein VFN49_12695 [Candidatus Aquilonibacter sp.]|nr:hypothetical protein [Candidatus Aquilonibacter sp.]
MIRFILPLTLIATMLGAAPQVSITGQLLAYQDGYVFFTSGNGFKVSPSLRVLDDATKKPATEQPKPRLFARAVFDDTGSVVELDLSQKPLPLEPLSPQVENYVVAASPSYPNPELSRPASKDTLPEMSNIPTSSGKKVLLNITVQVPPETPIGSQIYIATDTTGWNPQAIQLVRVDALHFRVVQRVAAGTILHYIYTRGSMATEERGENGLDIRPHAIVITDADVRAVNDVVYRWADQVTTNGTQIQPNTAPTPYNPAPFPNLPSSIPTPRCCPSGS